MPTQKKNPPAAAPPKPAPAAPAPPAPAKPPPKKRRWWLWGCLGCLPILVIVGIVIILILVGVFSQPIDQNGEQPPEEPPERPYSEMPPEKEQFDPDMSGREVTRTYKYSLRGSHTVTNMGPEVATPVKVDMAVFRDVDNYQRVLSEEIYPQDYLEEEDTLGNRFVHYEFESLAPGESLEFVTEHTLEVKAFVDRFGECLGQSITSFMQAEPLIESDAPAVQSMAAQITVEASDDCSKAFAAYNYVADNITYLYHNDESEFGALTTLQGGEGDCTEFADLFVALTRAAGVPARFVEGVVYAPDALSAYDQQHAWSEVYLPSTGWSPVDATWGQNPEMRDTQFARSDGEHFLLTRGRSLEPLQGMHFFAVRWWWYGADTDFNLDELWDIERIE